MLLVFYCFFWAALRYVVFVGEVVYLAGAKILHLLEMVAALANVLGGSRG